MLYIPLVPPTNNGHNFHSRAAFPFFYALHLPFFPLNLYYSPPRHPPALSHFLKGMSSEF
jgi:hypothetical protein